MEDHRPDYDYRVLSVRTIALAALALVVVGVGVAAWLLVAFGNGTAESANRLDAIKTAGTIVVGTGGAAALWLAARRQRTSEIALRQKDLEHALQVRMAAVSEADSAERRVTELYTKAADQLGADKAPVRLAGMYALERLAQSTSSQRQTVVNLLCAYLRMPFDALREDPDEVWEQERQVRLTAQRILTKHLRAGEDFWPGISIDLTGATLINADFAGCRADRLRHDEVLFSGPADFAGARPGIATFEGARFTDHAVFHSAEFAGWTSFAGASFAAPAIFNGATFNGETNFSLARFANEASFRGATFASPAGFVKVSFAGDALFEETRFNETIRFRRTGFAGAAIFRNSVFSKNARFDGSVFSTLTDFDRAEFHQYVEFSEAEFHGDTRFGHVRFHDSARFASTKFRGDALFEGSLVKLDVPNTVARDWPKIDRAQPGRYEVDDHDPEWGQLRYRLDTDRT